MSGAVEAAKRAGWCSLGCDTPALCFGTFTALRLQSKSMSAKGSHPNSSTGAAVLTQKVQSSGICQHPHQPQPNDKYIDSW